jgi:cell division septation protein DedD
MGHEEQIDGAGVEAENHAPDSQEPLFVEAFVEEVTHASAANAPDFYAVGVRLIKMSPVWLLTATGGFALLILLLSWVRPAVGEADAASIPNDAKSVVVQQQHTQAPVAALPSPETQVTAPAAEERAEVKTETRAEEPVQVETKTPAPVESAPVESAPAEPTRAERPKEPAGEAASADEAGAKFTVQVGSFNVESQANERISSLRAAGFDARSTEVELPGRGKWFRVQVGRFAEREGAAKVAAQLRGKAAAAGALVVPVR